MAIPLVQIPVTFIVIFVMIVGAATLPQALPQNEMDRLSRAIDDFFRDKFEVNVDHIRGKSALRDVLNYIVAAAVLNWDMEKYQCKGGPEVYFSEGKNKLMVVCDLSHLEMAVVTGKNPVSITYGLIFIGIKNYPKPREVPLVITIMPCDKAYLDRVIKRDGYVPFASLGIK